GSVQANEVLLEEAKEALIFGAGLRKEKSDEEAEERKKKTDRITASEDLSIQDDDRLVVADKIRDEGAKIKVDLVDYSNFVLSSSVLELDRQRRKSGDLSETKIADIVRIAM